MKICGLQKLTLIDYPGKLACSIFLFGCNFRCGFCHNPGLVIDNKDKNEIEEYSEKEILEFLESRKNYLEGVCITGGEPLLSVDVEFLKKIKEMGFLIKIDTNGSFPEKLRGLISEGLIDYVAMDIKTCKEKYKDVIKCDVDLDKIEESIKLIANLPEYEFRTTILESLHSKENVLEMVKWLEEIIGRRGKRFSLQGFKKEAELLDDNFKTENNTKENYLNELKEIVKEYFNEINVKV